MLPEQMILNTLLQASVNKRNPSWFPHALGRHCHTQTFRMTAQNIPMGSSLRFGLPCWLWGSSGRDYSLLYLYDPTQGLAHSRSGHIFHSAACFNEYIWPCHSLPPKPSNGHPEQNPKFTTHVPVMPHTSGPSPLLQVDFIVILGIISKVDFQLFYVDQALSWLRPFACAVPYNSLPLSHHKTAVFQVLTWGFCSRKSSMNSCTNKVMPPDTCSHCTLYLFFIVLFRTAI